MKNKIIHIIKTIKHILPHEKGAAIVEYAIILPFFLTLIIGGLEMGNIFMVNSSLEGAVSSSTRTAMTGALPSNYTDRTTYIKDLVTNSLTAAGVTSGVTITMNVYDSFANIGKPEPFVDQNGNQIYDVGECYTDVNNNSVWDSDMGSDGAGGEENIMIMKVDVNLPYMTGFMKSVMMGKLGTSLSASTAIRNEPFGGVAWEPSKNVICT